MCALCVALVMPATAKKAARKLGAIPNPPPPCKCLPKWLVVCRDLHGRTFDSWHLMLVDAVAAVRLCAQQPRPLPSNHTDTIQWAMPSPVIVPAGYKTQELTIREGQSLKFIWDTCGIPVGTPARLHVRKHGP